jgi:uncharacterized protein
VTAQAGGALPVVLNEYNDFMLTNGEPRAEGMTMTQRRTASLFLTALLAGILQGTLPAAALDYAPLDCAKAKSPAERTICSNYGLGQLEARTATLFEWATSFVAMGQRGDIQDAQRAFITKRNACKSNINCLRNAYTDRIDQLEEVMSRIKEKGPF